MNVRQKRFCDEYLVDCNATQAAIRAGYSEKYAHTNANKLLQNTTIKEYIDEQMKQIHSERVADAAEVMKYLTSVLRGESSAEVIVVEGVGEGFSEARRVQKAPDEKERLKAAELIGKRYGLFKENVDVLGAVPVVISGGEDLDD